MKKSSIMMAFCLSSLLAVSQKLKSDKVPAIVKESFAKRFPDVKKVEWEIDENNYEAEFKKGNEEWEIEFDATGEYIKSELELDKISDLPTGVQNTLKNDFAKFKAEEPEQVTLANGSKVYEVEMKMDGKKYELQFDETGKLLSKIEDIESDKD